MPLSTTREWRDQVEIAADVMTRHELFSVSIYGLSSILCCYFVIFFFFSSKWALESEI